MILPTCATCWHFRQDFGTKRGFCYGVMPLVNAHGESTDRQPTVKMNRPGCMAHRPLPEGVTTLVDGKSDYETPGDAAKLRHVEARTEHQMTPPKPSVGPLMGNGHTSLPVHESATRKGRR